MEDRSSRLLDQRTEPSRSTSSSSGPEPFYTTGAHQRFTSHEPLRLDWGGQLPSYTVAYETWGTLDSSRSNAILLHTGLSASSHAHSTALNPKPGWWEKFIGPGLPLDTSKYHVICTNVIGGCYGSTGPSSPDPANNEPYATRFPILTMQDMVRAQFALLDHLGIARLHASVGSSMGGMQSLAAGILFPERVGRIASISGCARSHPYSIAMRHSQRQALMMDPHWRRGFYYPSAAQPHLLPPLAGMKLARTIATVTYRSGPEWEMRFGRKRADEGKIPALCPDFLIETYLDHAGDKWCLEYDANSLLYISKAMDLFDLGAEACEKTVGRRAENQVQQPEQRCSLTLPDEPYQETAHTELPSTPNSLKSTPLPQQEPTTRPAKPVLDRSPPPDLVKGMRRLATHPMLVMGVDSDILFPAWQQKEIADAVRATGNEQVRHVELGLDVSLFGHDTFLLDVENVGGPLREFLG